MNNYVAEKHWFLWVIPSLISILTCYTLIIPIFVLGYTYLRCRLDKIEVKDGCLYSRLGLILIDKKSIPLDKISFVNIKSNIISEKLNFGGIEIQSSAFSKAITYDYIKNPEKLVEYINEHKTK